MRWEPGMRWECDEREGGWYDGVYDGAMPADAAWLPMLDDTRTQELVLAQIGERFADTAAALITVRGGATRRWIVAGNSEGLRDRDIAREGASEAEALVIALEAGASHRS